MSVTLHSGLLGVSSQTRRVGFSATAADSAARSSGSANATSRPKFGASSFSQWRSAQYIRRGATTRAPGAQAQEQRDRRRHARAEDQRRGGAFERADQRLGFAHGLVVGPAVDRPAPVGVGGIADEGRRDVQRRHQALRRLVDAAERLSGARALMCANDLLAFGVLRGLAAAQVAVPEEMAVVGYDDVVFASMLSPSLSSVRQPKYELGVAAAELLLEEVAGTPHEHRAIRFEPELVVRASTSPNRECSPGINGNSFL